MGKRTLLVCFNREIARHLHDVAGKYAGLDIYTFHSLCLSKMDKVGLNIKRDNWSTLPQEEQEEIFKIELPIGLVAAADKLPDDRYDAIVVDEGQDFEKDWIDMLQSLLRDPKEGVFYVFYDDRQDFYGRTFTVPDGFFKFSLSMNCRNTRRICNKVRALGDSGQAIEARAAEGREPEMFEYSTPEELVDLARKTVHRLTHDEGLKPEEIVILTGHGKDHSVLWKQPVLGNFRLTASLPPAKGEIACLSVYRFKGLESPAVVLAEMENGLRYPTKTLAYVGASRAKVHLVVLAHKDCADVTSVFAAK